MNKGAKAIISLALGVILVLGIYHIYKPQINSMANGTFGKVQRMIGKNESKPSHPSILNPNDKKTYIDWNGLKGQADHSGNVEFTHGVAGSILTENNRPDEVSSANHIKFDDGIDTSHLTNMGHIFEFAEGATDIDFGNNFDTSHVTDMSDMFVNYCPVQKINFGKKFDTSHVTNMSGMFASALHIKHLDLSQFNTSNVTNMSSMFESSGLTDLNLGSHFYMNNVKSTGAMFQYTKNLAHLEVNNNFDMKNVTEQYDMFGMSNPTVQSTLKAHGGQFDDSVNNNTTTGN